MAVAESSPYFVIKQLSIPSTSRSYFAILNSVAPLLNQDKSQVMAIQLRNDPPPLENQTLKEVNERNLLGLVIDTKLTLSKLIKMACNMYLHRLKQMGLLEKDIKDLYRTLVVGQIEYALPV